MLGFAAGQCLGEIRIFDKFRFFKSTFVVLQDKTPYRAYAQPATRHTSASWRSTCLLKAMGASPSSRPIYAAASRLDVIGLFAIGDMVSSVLRRVSGCQNALAAQKALR